MEPNLDRFAARLLCGSLLYEREGIFKAPRWLRRLARDGAAVMASRAACGQGIGKNGNGRGRAAMGSILKI